MKDVVNYKKALLSINRLYRSSNKRRTETFLNSLQKYLRRLKRYNRMR